MKFIQLDPPPPPPPPPPPACPVQCRLDGVREFPHFQDCNKYYECAHGFLFVMDCGEGEIFDVETLRCQTTGKCAVEKSKS